MRVLAKLLTLSGGALSLLAALCLLASLLLWILPEAASPGPNANQALLAALAGLAIGVPVLVGGLCVWSEADQQVEAQL